MRDSDPSNDSILGAVLLGILLSLYGANPMLDCSIRTEDRNREEKAALLERPNEEIGD